MGGLVARDAPELDVKVYENKRARVTVTTYPDGWYIHGESESHPTMGYDAEVVSCGCGRPSKLSTNRKQGGCRGWHWERVNKLATDTLKTYR